MEHVTFISGRRFRRGVLQRVPGRPPDGDVLGRDRASHVAARSVAPVAGRAPRGVSVLPKCGALRYPPGLPTNTPTQIPTNFPT